MVESKGPSGNIDQYYLSQDGSCGVEYVADVGYFTVTEFKAGAEANSGEYKKFETILLKDQSAGGRIKSTVTCEINRDEVVYQTRVPIFSDGVRTPSQVKTLTISQEGKQIYVKLKAKVMILGSTASCVLDF